MYLHAYMSETDGSVSELYINKLVHYYTKERSFNHFGIENSEQKTLSEGWAIH